MSLGDETERLAERNKNGMRQVRDDEAEGDKERQIELPLPLRSYFLNHFMKLDHDKGALTIYDQLKPAYAKYYREEEAVDLLRYAGFVGVRTYHRHGYSWTVMGEKPS